MKETNITAHSSKPPHGGALVGLYGLPYCDATVAVTKWLEAKGYTVTLHNYKTHGITTEKLEQWCKQLGWEKLLNKRSTTWRSLTKEEQEKVIDEASAIVVLLKNTSLIKRPVIEFGNNLLAGFDEKALSNIFK